MQTLAPVITNIRSSSPTNPALSALTGSAANAGFNEAMRDANAAMNGNRAPSPDGRASAAVNEADPLPDAGPDSWPVENMDAQFAPVDRNGKARLTKPVIVPPSRQTTTAMTTENNANENDALTAFWRLLPQASDPGLASDTSQSVVQDLIANPGLTGPPMDAGMQIIAATLVPTTFTPTDQLPRRKDAVEIGLPDKIGTERQFIAAGRATTVANPLPATDDTGKTGAQTSAMDKSDTERGALIKNAGHTDTAADNEFRGMNTAATTRVADAKSPTQKTPDNGPLNGLVSAIQTAALAATTPAMPPPAPPGIAAAIVTSTLGTPLGQPGWASELGRTVIKLTDRDIAEATLKINPEHLGPIDIAIDMHGKSACVAFVASTPEARQALEQSLPQLAQMLSDTGISLTQSSVGQGSQSGGRENASSTPKTNASAGDKPDLQAQPLPVTRTIVTRLGGVDTFA